MPPAESNQTPQYNLPPPLNENSGEVANDKPEQGQKGPETAAVSKSRAPSTAKTKLADFQLKNFTASKPQPVAASTSTNGNPQIADDNDLIEKEWVAKAKQIIATYKSDPYNQSKEMTEFKADYMKKRYNKVIKVDE
jgi:hypothetical protein